MKSAQFVIAASLVIVALLALSFAVPLRPWRTGEAPARPFALQKGGPAVVMPRRIWIDTDAGCGAGRTTDADDCLAILLLSRLPDAEVVGISTLYGNAPLPTVERTARELAGIVSAGRSLSVHRGSAGPLEEGGGPPQPAHRALADALRQGPLTLVALGPLTNIAAVLTDEPGLRSNVARLVAVMGRRPGHLFHPAEGEGSGGILLGHGPVFRDFNFRKDVAAATKVIGMHLPTTLIPYDAARRISIVGTDLDRMADRGAASAWVAERARAWLSYWNDDVGLPGFYPFDAVAAAYVAWPDLFDCAETNARIGRDWARDWLYRQIFGDSALVAGPEQGEAPGETKSRVVYCADVDPALHARMMSLLAPDADGSCRANGALKRPETDAGAAFVVRRAPDRIAFTGEVITNGSARCGAPARGHPCGRRGRLQPPHGSR